jgi:S1-C subfamily serine protease
MKEFLRKNWVFPVAIVVGFTGGLLLPVPAAAPPVLDASPTVLVKVDGGHGSGVHIGNGYIVTAAHVVGDSPGAVVKDDTDTSQIGTVLWVNKAYDLALIRIDRPEMRSAPLVCKPRLTVGDELQAVGNPLSLQFIHTWGRVASYVAERGPWKSSVIADMAVAPGMSGGPVFDRSGGVVGIVVGTAAVPMGMSASLVPITYFVPSSAVCGLMARA